MFDGHPVPEIGTHIGPISVVVPDAQVVVVPVSKGVVATGDLRHATRVVSARRLVQTAVAPSSETKEIHDVEHGSRCRRNWVH